MVRIDNLFDHRLLEGMTAFACAMAGVTLGCVSWRVLDGPLFLAGTAKKPFSGVSVLAALF